MRTIPSYREFRRLSASGKRVPVAACLPLKPQPCDLFEALRLRPPHLLLESARIHPVTGRYSVIVGEPTWALSAKGRQVRLQDREGRIHSRQGDPLRVLQRLLEENRALRPVGFPPFVGGAVGFIGFDACRLWMALPSRAAEDLSLPDLGFLFCDQAVVLDHAQGKLWALALAAGGRPGRAYEEALGRVETLVARATRSVDRGSRIVDGEKDPSSIIHHPPSIQSTHTRAEFERMVRAAKRFIAEGEIYQANLSQRLSMPLTDSPWRLYQRLTQINPSPFAAYADFGFLQIVSASPERFLRVRGREIETRPIAGTRPRGETVLETARLRRELILNEKERAEHLMLVDLERNDLGRICRYGSVEVDDLMVLEEYSHVIHIVSNVRGTLREGVGLRQMLAATFPGGTISGCPKIRCLEIIDSLEAVRRQLYSGAMGYLSYTGDLDLNLLIRTAFVHAGQVHIQAGAGIVADSDPGREYEETLHKAEALRILFDAQPQTFSEPVPSALHPVPL